LSHFHSRCDLGNFLSTYIIIHHVHNSYVVKPKGLLETDFLADQPIRASSDC